MACHDLEYQHQPVPAPYDGWMRMIVDALLPALRHRPPRLDVEELPDHIKRDLGFLDGRSSNRARDY